MIRDRTRLLPVVCLAALAVLASAHTANSVIVDFSGPPQGTIVASPFNPGTTFPGFALDVANLGGGPHTLTLIDSHCPTGGDHDLGTPNEDFGGPGVGAGGGSGQPGQNDKAFGNLLIIAENNIDDDGDGIIDEPDDEAGGGVFVFRFDEPVAVTRVVLVDIDADEGGDIRFYANDVIIGEVWADPLGDNSVQTLTGTEFPGADRIEVQISGSGAIAEIEFVPLTSPTEEATWGSVKIQFSRE